MLDMETKGLVSVIVPCYNQGEFLNEALESIFQQSYEHWECIIVNDGSLDETEIIAKQWCFKDERFKYIKKENGGLSCARNSGLNLAKGIYIQFLDADDILIKEKLFSSIDRFMSDAELGLVVSNYRNFVYSTKENLFPKFKLSEQRLMYESILFEWDEEFTIPIHCGFFKASLFKNFRFPENLKSKEDWIMWVTLFKNKPKTFFIDEDLAYYRINNKGLSSNLDNMSKNLIKAYEYLYEILNQEEFKKLSILLFERNYNSNKQLLKKIKDIKNSKTHLIGLKLKKILFFKKLMKFKNIFFKIITKYDD